MDIVRVREHNWEELRTIRLRALADAPYAFASTLDREHARSEDDWRRWAAGDSSSGGGATFAATDEDRWMGLVSCFVEDAHPNAVHLVSMWVDPAARGRGVGRRLVEAVVEWAREQGARAVHLWVADGNDAALALYRKAGFEPTGDRMPLPSDPLVMETKMRLVL